MIKEKLTRSYLETLSFSELLSLANELDFDVPENLDYRLLVGELLQFSQEEQEDLPLEMQVSEEDSLEPEDLPFSYNITEVKLMMRNPAWGYVYWNISEADYEAISKNSSSQLLLRVCSFSQKNQIKPDDSFNIKISLSDNEQYILLPAGKKYFRVDLLFAIGVSVDIVASSNILQIPSSSPILQEYTPGKKLSVSKPVELSGINELLKAHYTNHRESFI